MSPLCCQEGKLQAFPHNKTTLYDQLNVKKLRKDIRKLYFFASTPWYHGKTLIKITAVFLIGIYVDF